MTSEYRPDRIPGDRAEGQLRDWLVDRLVLMGCDPEGIDVDTPFHDLGVGSRDAVVLAGELAEHLGRPVSPVDLWEHPSVAALARFALDPEAGSAATESVSAGPNPDTDTRTGADDLIAVVGVGCRFPGGISGPQRYWDFLLAEGDAIGHVDPQRWESFADGTAETEAALARTTTWGGYLDDIDAFDAEFFDISPSEADKMDPQQRLLLEVSHEALEDAGIPAESLRHSQTGVFVGACAGEYGFLATADLADVDNWSGTGGALSVIANRVSYHYDLRGPSITVDTACSSSLVAIHLAVASLRSGESSTALAAGVNVMLSPAITRSFDRNDAMSPSGRCHSFDAAADGYVRSEGCGVVVLKRLADARRDGDHVLAVVRGSAINSDGHSNGLMAPNPSAQMAVLRAAYTSAAIAAREVDYVEAHGTGTLLGDPIEARALGAVAGRGRPADDPLLIGAVKSNLGHLEAAAGIAGFVKVALALEKGCLPATPGFSDPNPHIDFDNLRLQVVAETTPWPATGRPRRGGVSAFGFGGTNAHLVLEQAPEPETLTRPVAASVDGAGRSPKPTVATLVVAGRSRERIATTAGALADWLDADGAAMSLAEVAHGLDHHRDRARTFATVVATDHAAAITGLRALADGASAPGVVAAHEQPCRPGTVFVYSGQGSQWVGMARGLLARDPAFADALEEIEPDFREQVGFSLIDVIRSGAPVTGIDRIQPVLTGLQLALTRLWRAHGIVPDAVIGHSMGEAAAAVVAGALSVADGLKVIATRSRLMRRLAGQGAMALIELDATSAHELVAGFAGVTVAVLASPRQCVIAGPPEQVDAVVARVAAQDRLARRVEVDVASHHPIIDPVLPDLRAALADLSPRRPHLPLLSTTLETGEPTFDADYWCANLRNPVRFAPAVARAGADHGVFVEVSPHPLLTHAIDETLSDIHHHAVPTLLRDADELTTFHTHLNLARTDRRHIPAHPSGPHPQLPTTPWHHCRHWFATRAHGRRSPVASAGFAPRPGTLLGEHIAVADTTHLWRADLTPDAMPYPGHHLLHGLEVVPVSVLVATLGGAAAHLGADALTDIDFTYPIAVDRPRRIHVVADAGSVSIASSAITDDDTSRWVRHVTARPTSSVLPGRRPSPHPDNGSRTIDTADLVAMTPTSSTADLLAEWGVQGQPFDWEVARIARGSGRMLADIGLPDPSPASMLDAAAHVARLVDESTRDLMVPARIDSVLLPATLRGNRAVLDIRVVSDDADLVVDIVGSTEDADDALLVRGLRFTPVDAEPGVAEAPVAEADPRSLIRTVVWREDTGTDAAPAVTNTPNDAVTVLGDAHALATALMGAGVVCRDRAEDARHVIYVAPATTAGLDHAAAAAAMSSEVTALIARMARTATPQTLWIVTRGVREPNSPADLPQSALWGLATVMAEEHPDAWGGLIDLASGADPATVAPLIAERLGRPPAGIAALRDGRLLRPSLEPLEDTETPKNTENTETRDDTADSPSRGGAALRCRPDAAYLVTGGLGALGRVIAGRLVDHGARRLILVGRTGLPSRRDWDRADLDPILRDRIDTVRDLESRGVTVAVVALDVADRAAVQAFLTRRDDEGAAPVRGVVHAAGVTENRLLAETDDVALTTVMRPKIAGAQVLHETFGDTLDFFEMTGSAGVHFGIAGQGGYAAANAYLDALARLRRHTGTPALTIDWVAWQGLGFAVDADIVAAELARRGSRPVTPAEALHAWDLISESGVAHAVVLPPPPSAPNAEDSGAGSTGRPAWSQMARPDLLAGLRDGLRTILARELRMSEADLLTDVPFAEFGLNSLMAMSIRRDAEKLAGLELSATMLWNHPTIDALADYLATRIAGDDEPAAQLPADDSGGLLDDLFADAESTPSPLGAEHGLQ
ncbi:beta-ketoacyl synthase N-terminal-like domain-containing protein [Gordonia sp. L191]|uniref:type I polyketide synthase n=1 Tax=Gordonia sp. L191 TaxID=2982699 RepID=UPI0024BFA974|nr:type I polyketide synthase [Gordonia sp. L191]WHU49456.1 beta-ketoacyl synthase N-terminal-like domain-containing protein [Gordonia sp. L191]